MAEPNRTFAIKQGDLLPILRGRIFDKTTGVGQDLTGADLRFHMKDFDTGDLLVDGEAVMDPDQVGNIGWWTYEWQPGDTGPYSEPEDDETLVFKGEIQATYGTKPLTSPNTTHFTVKMRNQLN